MIDITAIVKNTNAYRIIESDKRAGSLSHAYLVLCQDKAMLKDYVKELARLMCCSTSGVCGECRNCSLIGQEIHPDVIFYPQVKKGEKDKDNKKANGSITAEEVLSLIEESYLRPVENDKKVFVILNAQEMNAVSQNKLLKTLEEPPKNVHIILGATNEHALLSTVKSRVKKIEIPAFESKFIEKALESVCPDKQKLSLAISCGDGSIGKALALYDDNGLQVVTDLVIDMLVNMNSSKDVLDYSTKIQSSKVELDQFLAVTELLLRDMLVLEQGKIELVSNKQAIKQLNRAQKFNTGAILNALDAVLDAGKRRKFNVNETAVIEWLLFQILEGKYKWQKF